MKEKLECENCACYSRCIANWEYLSLTKEEIQSEIEKCFIDKER